jgi:hypothetical protein
LRELFLPGKCDFFFGAFGGVGDADADFGGNGAEFEGGEAKK